MNKNIPSDERARVISFKLKHESANMSKKFISLMSDAELGTPELDETEVGTQK